MFSKGKRMADDCDLSDQKEALVLESGIREAQLAASKIPRGYAGDCKYCGESSKRLVGDACAPCRDKRHLP